VGEEVEDEEKEIIYGMRKGVRIVIFAWFELLKVFEADLLLICLPINLSVNESHLKKGMIFSWFDFKASLILFQSNASEDFFFQSRKLLSLKARDLQGSLFNEISPHWISLEKVLVSL